MIITLNEQEVIDGICVRMANGFDGIPEDVHVIGFDLHKNGKITAEAEIYNNRKKLDAEEISDGIIEFFEEYHEFNPEVMEVELTFDEEEGFGAIVSVNE